jgi:replicative DNA helicase
VFPTRPASDLAAWVRARARLRALREAARALPGPGAADPVRAATQAEAVLAAALAAGAGEDGAVLSGREAVDRFLGGGLQALIPTGVAFVDGTAGGWRRGGLHLVLGLTGRGKTALLAQSAMAAAEAGYRAYIVSAEMTADDLVPRLLGDRVVRYADASGAPLTVARIARREAEVLPLVAQAAGEVAEALGRITIDARGWPRISDVLSTLHRHHAACPVDLVLVDYLQLLSSPGAGRSREQEVREIAVALKQAAMQLQVAVVAAGQLVDPPAWSADATAPRTPAVRESRAAAHAADLILELERLEEAAAGARYAGYLLRLRKLRHSGGEGAEEEVLFDRHSCRFVPARTR